MNCCLTHRFCRRPVSCTSVPPNISRKFWSGYLLTKSSDSFPSVSIFICETGGVSLFAIGISPPLHTPLRQGFCVSMSPLHLQYTRFHRRCLFAESPINGKIFLLNRLLTARRSVCYNKSVGCSKRVFGHPYFLLTKGGDANE